MELKIFQHDLARLGMDNDSAIQHMTTFSSSTSKGEKQPRKNESAEIQEQEEVRAMI